MSVARAAARSALQVLSADPAFRELSDRVESLRRTQRILSDRWPALRLRILAARDDSLTIAAPNAALAARCRQLEPSMIEALRPAHPLLASIRFKQDPALAMLAPLRPPREPISEGALDLLDQGTARLPAGPLREAMLRLVRRHRSAS